MTEPILLRRPAILVVPYLHGIYCRVDGSEPFVNQFVSRRWRDDGSQISFMLDTCNFDFREPMEMMDYIVEIDCSRYDTNFLNRIVADDLKTMLKRPGGWDR